MGNKDTPGDSLSTSELQNWFFWSVKIGSIILLVAGIVCFASPFFVGDIHEKISTAKLALIVFICLAGLIEMFLGVLLALVGVAASYEFDVGAKDIKVSLASSSPGILLIVCSTFLVAFALSRPIEFDETVHQKAPAADNRPADQSSASPDEVDNSIGNYGPLITP